MGREPGLVILHGALESSLTHVQLALALCSSFPVYIPDRFGFGSGSSQTHRNRFDMQAEIQALEMVLLHTGARYVLGISEGGMIALHAALQLSVGKNTGGGGLIKKLAVFNPSTVADDVQKIEKEIERLVQEIDEGKSDQALVTARRVSETGSWASRKLPRVISVPLANHDLDIDQKRRGTDHSMKKVLPALKHEYRLRLECYRRKGDLRGLKDKDVAVLLLNGTKSPRYLRRHVQDLKRELPSAKYVDVRGMDASGLRNFVNEDDRSRVAEELRRFVLDIELPV